MSEAFWQWECDVQQWWARRVVAVAEVYGTPMPVRLRMLRLGWRLLLVVTWPQALARRLEFLLSGS